MNTSLTEAQWETYLTLLERAKSASKYADDYLTECLRVEAVKRYKDDKK